MRLKSLEIQGFKSFDDKTIISFDTNITGVVGPNGCGKSNIVDAIRWVMGEQSAKHLRGRNMEDVIFSGTQTRAPNSLSGVELTFLTDGASTPPQYSGYKEISIGRKLYRTGESEYFINRQPVRLKDITDLFLGTGVGTKAYSIIEQGRVGQIVNSKPEERRFIIEEAAGISKFKSRKEAALRRMEATRLNLSRLTDIIVEIERQRESLTRQAKKAERYKVLYDELKTLDLSLAAHLFGRLDKLQVECLEDLRRLGDADQEMQGTLATDEGWVEAQRLKLTEIETVLSDLQQVVFDWDNSIKLTESKLETKKREHERFVGENGQMEHQEAELKSDLAGSHNGLSQVSEGLVRADLDVAWLTDEVAIKETQLAQLQAASQELFKILETARHEAGLASNQLAQINTRSEGLNEKLQGVISKREVDETELAALTQKCGNIQKLVKESQSGLGQIKQLKFSLSERTQSLNDDLVRNEGQIKLEQDALESLKEELMTKKSRLASLEELERNFEGYQQGPKALLKMKSDGIQTGIMAVVADVIETEPRYENAVSAVLGERMQCLVVKNHGEGVHCAELLKSQQVGRGSFVPVYDDARVSFESISERLVVNGVALDGSGVNVYTENYLKAPAATTVPQMGDEVLMASPSYAMDGILGNLKNHVSLKAGYEKLSQLLFGDVILVDSLKHAMDAWIGLKMPVVTLDGETISLDGIITGGTAENTAKALLEKKREIKDLSELVTHLVNRVKAKEEVLFDLRHKIQALKSRIDEMRTSDHEEDLRLAKQEKDILHAAHELEDLNVRRGRLAQQVFEAVQTSDEITAQLSQLGKDLIVQKEIYDLNTSLVTKQKSREEECRSQLTTQQETLTHQKIQLAQAIEQKVFLQRETERLLGQKIKLGRDIIALQERLRLGGKKIIFSEDRISFLTRNVQRLIAGKRAADEMYHQHKNEFEVLYAAIAQREQGLKEKRREQGVVKDAINATSIKLTETRAQLARIAEQTLERYQMVAQEIDQSSLPDPATFDVASVEERANELRQKIAGIGGVNISAIDELAQINQRYDFLTRQRTDLEQSLTALESAIQKINRTTRERFKETFEMVNEKFTKLFPRLFKGGHAYLQMTDPDNILETGIDIIAQPPGKKLQSISLLSGGEKALTAVSLLFAIFLIKPAPFCLLDEVDAPLDDANVDRYNEIVKEMANRTQFIVITHNKRTMQVTDCLFGVTMQEAGVSQIVSVNLNG